MTAANVYTIIVIVGIALIALGAIGLSLQWLLGEIHQQDSGRS